MEAEHKQFQRYKPAPDALYIFVHNSTTPWEIMDISKGGLSFQYTPIPGEEMQSELIGIIGSNYNQSELASIPCRVVYDHLVLSEGRRFSGKLKRRRGLKFVELTETQTRSLELLLDNTQIMLAG